MVSRNEKEALSGIDDRISLLEKRLDNAKAARDAYIQHLRGRYPNWRPPLPSLSYQEPNFDFSTVPAHQFPNHREPLLNRLSTSDYQWDITQHNRPKISNFAPKNSSFPSSIPLHGPLLESDLRRSKIRLREISDELRSMRMDRMSLSTEEWMQLEPYRLHKNPLRLNLNSDSDPSIDHLEEANARLATIDFVQSSPVETPTEERKMEITTTEQHEQLMSDMRSGLIPMENTISTVISSAPKPGITVESKSLEPVASEKPHVHFEAPPTIQEAPPPVEDMKTPPKSSGKNAENENVVTKSLQNSVKSLFSSAVADSDSDSDNFIGKPSTSQPTPNLSSLLSSFGGQKTSKFQDSDESDDGLTFSKPTSAFSRPSAKKSNMFGNASDEDDDFFN